MKESFTCSKCFKTFFTKEGCLKHEQSCKNFVYYRVVLSFQLTYGPNSWYPCFTYLQCTSSKQPDFLKIVVDDNNYAVDDYDNDIQIVKMFKNVSCKEEFEEAKQSLIEYFANYQKKFIAALQSLCAKDLEKLPTLPIEEDEENN